MRILNRIFILIAILHVSQLQANTNPNTYLELAHKKLSIAQKLSRVFHFSIGKKKFTHAWICYQIDKAIPVNPKLFNKGASNLTTVLPALKESDGKPETIFALKFFLQSGRPRILEVNVISKDDYFDRKGIPLFWLGIVTAEESFDFLDRLFDMETHDLLRRELVQAMSYHDLAFKYSQFTNKVFMNSFSQEVKTSAILGLQNFPAQESIDILKRISFDDNIPCKLRNAAIHALGQNSNELAHQVLAEIVLSQTDEETRKQASFWLAQTGTSQAAKILNKIVHSAKSAELRRFAIFAISQMPNNSGKFILENILKSNAEVYLRETAAFWMNVNNEDKNLDLLIDYFKSFDN